MKKRAMQENSCNKTPKLRESFLIEEEKLCKARNSKLKYKDENANQGKPQGVKFIVHLIFNIVGFKNHTYS
jgi:hypothetical protein